MAVLVHIDRWSPAHFVHSCRPRPHLHLGLMCPSYLILVVSQYILLSFIKSLGAVNFTCVANYSS